MRTQRSRSTLILSTIVALTAALGPARSGMAQALDPRFGFTGDFGSGVGYTSSFWTAEAFIPLLTTQESNLFADWRPIIGFNGLLANNLGTGYRMYSPAQDRMFGFNTYWDVRDSGNAVYHQVGGGFETVGRNWAFRTNFYMPITPAMPLLGLGPLSAPFFIGNNIGVAQDSFFQTALQAADAEVGVPVPTRFGLWAYGGIYALNPVAQPVAIGGRARLEAKLTDNVTANASLQHDNLFGFTGNLQLAWYWRGFKPKLGYGGQDVTGGTGYQRLATPVQRNYNVVVHNFTRSQNLLLHSNVSDTATGLFPLIRVVHVDNTSAGQNLGTFENPATSLATASATSRQGDIIFVHNSDPLNDTTGMRRGILLQNGQRLLAGGFDHIVSTIELGPILLPRNFAGAAFAGQNITNVTSGSTVVVLANNTEVSGFIIYNSRNHGIASSAANGSQIFGTPLLGDDGNLSNQLGVSINRNVIVDLPNRVPNNVGAGIFLNNPFGTFNIGSADPRNGTNGMPVVNGINGGASWGNFIGLVPDAGVIPGDPAGTGTAAGHPDGGILVHKDTSQPNANANANVPRTTLLTITGNTISNNGDGFPQSIVTTGSINGPGVNVTLVAPTVGNNGNNTNGINAGDTDNGIGIAVEGGNPLFRASLTPIITNNFINNNGAVPPGDTVPRGDGIHLRASQFASISSDGAGNDPLIDGNTITFNSNSGIFVAGIPQGQAGNDQPLVGSAAAPFAITNNVITDNGTPPANLAPANGNGIEIQGSAAATMNLRIGDVFAGNVIQRNAVNGILVRTFTQGNNNAGAGPSISTTITDNIIGETVAGDGNGNGSGAIGGALFPVGSGVRFQGESAGTITASLQRNTIIGNELNGVFIRGIGGGQQAAAGATMNINITDTNVISANGMTGGVTFTNVTSGNNNNQTTRESAGNGIAALIDDPTSFNLTVSNGLGGGNTIDNNFNNGISLVDTSSLAANITISNNTSISFNGSTLANLVTDIDTHHGIFAVFSPQNAQNQAAANNILTITGNAAISNNGANVGGNFLVGDGVHVEVPNGQLTLAIGDNTAAGENFINNNAGDGVHIRSGAALPNIGGNNNAGAALVLATIARNTMNSNGFGTPNSTRIQPAFNGNGLYIEAAGTSSFYADGIGNDGLVLPASPIATLVSSQVIQNNTINGNGSNGMWIRSTGTSNTNTLLVSIQRNQVSYNGGGTINVANGVTSPGVANLTDAPGFAANGLRIDTGAGTAFHGVVNLNDGSVAAVHPIAPNLLTDGFTHNGDHGVFVNLGSDGTLNPTQTQLAITFNTANNNNLDGILVSNTGASNNVNISNNVTTANANGLNGIVYDVSGNLNTATINNNVVRGNGTAAAAFVIPTAIAGDGRGNGIVANALGGNNNSITIGTSTQGNIVTGNQNDGIVVNNNPNATAAGLVLRVDGNTVGGPLAPTGANTPPTTTAGVGNGLNGIEINLIGANVGTALAPASVSNNVVRNNGFNGILINAQSTNAFLNVNSNQTNNNGALALTVDPLDTQNGNGVFINYGAASQANTINVNGTSVGGLVGQSNSNFRDGIRVAAAAGSQANTVTVASYTQVRSNGTSALLPAGSAGDGIHLIDSGTATRFTINNNVVGGSVANGNGGDGILVEAIGLHNPLSAITNNQSSFNGQNPNNGALLGNGIEYISSNAGAQVITIGGTPVGGNTNLSNNTHNGILVTMAPGIGSNTVNILGNSGINSNGLDGIQVDLGTGAQNTANIQGNIVGTTPANALSNARYGIDVFTSALSSGDIINIGTTTANTANNSGESGIRVAIIGVNHITTIGSATIGNTANGNNRTNALAGSKGGIEYSVTGVGSNGDVANINSNIASSNLNGASGIQVTGGAGSANATFNIGTLGGNTTSSNNGFGINVASNGTATTNIDNNTVSGNTLGGINYTASINNNTVTIGDAAVGGVGNAVSGNSGDGIHVTTTAAVTGAFTANVIANQSSGNTGAGSDGVQIDAAGSSGTYNVNTNNNLLGLSSNAGDGINFQVTGNNNTLAANGNLGVNSNAGNGIEFAFSGAASGNVYSASNNTIGAIGAGNTGNGLSISVTGTGANNAGLTVNDNVITRNSGNGVFYSVAAGAGAGNNITMLRNTSTFNTLNGMSISSGANSVVTILGSTITNNTQNGILYAATAGNNNRLFIASNPIPVGPNPPAPTNASTIGANGQDGIRLTIAASSSLFAQVDRNDFSTANTGASFRATTTASATSVLGLQFLVNTPKPASLGQYVFAKGAGSTFQFEGPGDVDAPVFTNFQTTTNGNVLGNFNFTATFVNADEVPFGTFFPDPGPPR